MKELDKRKAIGSDEVLRYILKECRQKMVELICDVIMFFGEKEKSLKNGKELI